jgi:hypothetical protein
MSISLTEMHDFSQKPGFLVLVLVSRDRAMPIGVLRLLRIGIINRRERRERRVKEERETKYVIIG